MKTCNHFRQRTFRNRRFVTAAGLIWICGAFIGCGSRSTAQSKSESDPKDTSLAAETRQHGLSGVSSSTPKSSNPTKSRDAGSGVEPSGADNKLQLESLDFTPYTDWIAPPNRHRVAALDTPFTDQAGRQGKFAELVDRPVVCFFFYTRCQNTKKCSASVTHSAALQTSIEAAGLRDKVRLLMISYEPQYDTPERLEVYGQRRGIRFSQNTRMLRLAPDRQQNLVDALQAPVSYNSGWVNVHGVSLYLLDAKGRFVRKYHTLLWDNDRVVEDLMKLSAEKS